MHPQKKFYRQRAHSNPIADHCFDYPPCPDDQDWSQLFPHVRKESLSGEAINETNVLSDPQSNPVTASAGDVSSHYVHFLDIGCGYGGLLVALSPLFPDRNILGIEIRVKVCDYVQDRIRALRATPATAHSNAGTVEADSPTASPAAVSSPGGSSAQLLPDPVSIQSGDGTSSSSTTLNKTLIDKQHKDDCDGQPHAHSSGKNSSRSSPFQNIACIRSNAMKYLPNFFPKASIEKMFFLFPDPHFKKQKHKWRIISQQLLAEYAFIMRIGGKVYIATDVKDLFDWMVGHFNQHPLFHEDQEKDQDPVVPLLFDSTEEGKKVTRMGGQKFAAVFVRIRDPAEH